jgi:hypothetical protein
MIVADPRAVALTMTSAKAMQQTSGPMGVGIISWQPIVARKFGVELGQSWIIKMRDALKSLSLSVDGPAPVPGVGRGVTRAVYQVESDPVAELRREGLSTADTDARIGSRSATQESRAEESLRRESLVVPNSEILLIRVDKSMRQEHRGSQSRNFQR